MYISYAQFFHSYSIFLIPFLKMQVCMKLFKFAIELQNIGLQLLYPNLSKFNLNLI